MVAPQPVVRVGIVSWNTADELDRCLSSLPAALDGLEAEIVVVDNASNDDSVERASQHRCIRIIRNDTNEGYARAMNRALSDSSAPVLLALNPDTQAPPGSLRRLIEALLDDPSIGLVVPQLRNVDGSIQHSVNRFPSVRLTLAASLLPAGWHARSEGRWWVPGTATHSVSEDIDWAIGAVHVIRALALGGTPPYSERWFMYVEDLDLCWRLDRAGWRRRLEAEVWVTHTGNAAGVQAWGTDSTLRWMPCSYDFYALAHSNISARVWAGANVLALSLWSIIGLANPAWGPFPVLPGGRKAQAHRVWKMRGQMRIHLAVLLAGPKSMSKQAARPGIGAGPVLSGPPRPKGFADENGDPQPESERSS
jgi:GT2 family glycosyltransferase